ncbi:lactate utilization protein [Clostridiaceae bacterium 35-E11]
MDKNVDFVIEKRVERTIKNLEKNYMRGYFVQNEEEAVKKIQELIHDGDTVSVGGSMTLFEVGAMDLLRNGKYHFLDRYEEGLTADQLKDIYRKSFAADAYLTSSNALTEEGELYNVDGRGNRVAAMLYGPDKVIVVVGINKIVKNLEEAIIRNREWAAPANAKRLSRSTPCATVGCCMDCNSKERICNEYTLIKKQMDPERMHVIIVNKALGY